MSDKATDNGKIDRIIEDVFPVKFYKHRPVLVHGISGDGSQACVEYVHPEDGSHAHIPADQITDTRYPDVEVRLSGGHDGNTGAIMFSVTKALRKAGYSEHVASEFRQQVFDCESYDAVLQLVMRWVNVT